MVRHDLSNNDLVHINDVSRTLGQEISFPQSSTNDKLFYSPKHLKHPADILKDSKEVKRVWNGVVVVE